MILTLGVLPIQRHALLNFKLPLIEQLWLCYNSMVCPESVVATTVILCRGDILTSWVVRQGSEDALFHDFRVESHKA